MFYCFYYYYYLAQYDNIYRKYVLSTDELSRVLERTVSGRNFPGAKRPTLPSHSRLDGARNISSCFRKPFYHVKNSEYFKERDNLTGKLRHLPY